MHNLLNALVALSLFGSALPAIASDIDTKPNCEKDSSEEARIAAIRQLRAAARTNTLDQFRKWHSGFKDLRLTFIEGEEGGDHTLFPEMIRANEETYRQLPLKPSDPLPHVYFHEERDRICFDSIAIPRLAHSTHLYDYLVAEILERFSRPTVRVELQDRDFSTFVVGFGAGILKGEFQSHLLAQYERSPENANSLRHDLLADIDEKLDATKPAQKSIQLLFAAMRVTPMAKVLRRLGFQAIPRLSIQRGEKNNFKVVAEFTWGSPADAESKIYISSEDRTIRVVPGNRTKVEKAEAIF